MRKQIYSTRRVITPAIRRNVYAAVQDDDDGSFERMKAHERKQQQLRAIVEPELTPYIESHYNIKWSNRWKNFIYLRASDIGVNIDPDVDIVDVELDKDCSDFRYMLRSSKCTGGLDEFWYPGWDMYIDFEYSDKVSVTSKMFLGDNTRYTPTFHIHENMSDSELRTLVEGLFDVIGYSINQTITTEKDVQNVLHQIGLSDYNPYPYVPPKYVGKNGKLRIPIKVMRPYLKETADMIETGAMNRGFSLVDMNKYAYSAKDSTDEQAAYTLQFKADDGSIVTFTDFFEYDDDEDAVIPYRDMVDVGDELNAFFDDTMNQLGIQPNEEEY